MKNQTILIIVALAVIAGIAIGWGIGHSPQSSKKPLYWVDSMEPMIHYPAPGKSRMGMELTPVYPDEAADQSTVQISPAVVNNLGVRTAVVTQGMLDRRIETVGYVEPDEHQISHIHTYADGWVRKLNVKAVGDAVKSHQVVMQFYSPILVTVQEEYLIALGSGNQSLIDASVKRLQAFHISDEQIHHLKETRQSSQLIDVYSNQNGIVVMLNIREGMYVTPETEMMSIVDLSTIWMIAQVFEDQANWVKVGEKAEAKLTAFPDKVWDGVVEYIYPQIDTTTRSLQIRLKFNNPGGVLKPNMYANISLFVEPKSNVLSIPLEALIRSSQGNRVIVKVSDGQFQARAVKTGIESGERVEILSGLKAGEAVVTSGQFLIDSETNLEAGLERIDSAASDNTAQHPTAEPNMVIKGVGVITNINPEKHTLTMKHEAIPELNWPEMTMDFSVDRYVDINQFKTGDSVQFNLKKDNEGSYDITSMTRASN
jgi:Cu(I)/Ag(I) efflux system membrane fusion protein